MTEEKYRLVDTDSKEEGETVRVYYLILETEYLDEPLVCIVQDRTPEGFWLVQKMKQSYDHDLEMYSWERGGTMLVNPAYIVMADWMEARWVTEEEYERMFEEDEE